MDTGRLWLPALTALAAACAPAPPTEAELARLEAPARDRCATARADDFEGAGAADLQRFAYTLTRNEGAAAGLKPGDVTVAISDARPKPGPLGVIAGEIGCAGPGGQGGPYRITLFQRALEGRQLHAAYHTVAREFQHIVQMERDKLACNQADPDAVPRYEREALAAAERLVPTCK